MHRVKALRLALAQVQHARGDDPQARTLEALVDVADQVAGDAVGLDDGQGSLERHGVLGRRENQPRILALAAALRQLRWARKCPSVKEKSDAEAFAAAALAPHVGIAEAECLVEPL